MRKNIFRLMMLAAMPMLLALGITSCAEHDIPVDPNPLADQVKGIWWTLFDLEGTTATGQAFTRVGTGFQLLEDGTGYGATFYFNNDEGDPIEMRGTLHLHHQPGRHHHPALREGLPARRGLLQGHDPALSGRPHQPRLAALHHPA